MLLTGESLGESTQNGISPKHDDSLLKKVETILHDNMRNEGFDFFCEGFGGKTGWFATTAGQIEMHALKTFVEFYSRKSIILWVILLDWMQLYLSF